MKDLLDNIKRNLNFNLPKETTNNTSSSKDDSFANWEEDEELGIIDPVKDPFPKPDMK